MLSDNPFVIFQHLFPVLFRYFFQNLFSKSQLSQSLTLCPLTEHFLAEDVLQALEQYFDALDLRCVKNSCGDIQEFCGVIKVILKCYSLHQVLADKV